MEQEPPRDERWELYAGRLHEHRLLFVQFQKDYGEGVIKSLFLLNGGAAIAVLTLIGALFAKDGSKSEMVAASLFHGTRPALISFGVGLVATVFASMLGWLNFNAQLGPTLSPHELLRLARGGEPEETPLHIRAMIAGTFVLAPCACIVSVLSFIRGGMFISQAMKVATAALIH